MAVRRNYRINLRNYGNPPAIMVSQYDENYDLVFEVYDGVVPATGLNTYTVKLVGRQPGDDLALKYEFTGTVSGIANNILSFTIDTTMTGRAGKGTAEIVILDTTNDVKFASFNLPVYVEKAAVPDDAIDADVERAQEIAEQVEELIDGATEGAEAWAVGQRGGVDVESTDPTYHNNAKYYSEVAQDIADSIGIDATLSISGKAADAKKTGDEISSLKEDLNNLAITGTLNVSKEITWKNGYVNNGGAILSSSAAKFGIVQMNTGETLHLSTGGSGIAVLSSTTENDVSVGDSVTPIQLKAGTGYESFTYTATANINIVACVKKDEYSLSVTIDSKILENSADIAELSAVTAEVKSKTDNTIVLMQTPVYVDNTVTASMTTGACLTTGQIRSDYDTYEYTQKISVSVGDILTPVSTYNDAYFRYVCAYNGTSVVSNAGASSGVTSYIVPEGIDGVVVTTQISKAVTAVNVKHQTGTEDEYHLVNQELGCINWKGNLASGQSVELMGTNVRFNTVWCFTGHISTMGKITLAVKTTGGTVKELCSVDSTNLYYRLNNGNTASVAHGLTIADDLQIRIDSPFKVNELGSITICSDGVEYTLAETPYGTDMNGVPYLLSTGAVMTDCAFSWIPKDIDKPIWVFGDSWVSMYDTRWTYYMVRDGYVNSWMLNGFAGEDTDEAYDSLLNLLTIRKPDYIVWLLGMNNGDSSMAVNTVWKNIYDKLVQLCTDYKINLILYTVPNTPTINNNYKNTIVRNSGYRYIDGVSAVGDDGNGNWFTGYEQSSSDHNHTSSKGARALYYRILTDFPEIAGNSL